MADTRKGPSASTPGDNSSPDGSGSLEELRHLILAPEQEALDRLHERIANPDSRTEDVSGVVAEAIQLRREQGGSDALSEALSPTIETALRESVRKDPSTLADALFPVMGPAIRRSILETLRSFLESFNQVLDQSLSWQGLKWRFEAMRTGRSFTDVALLHSLVFRVEQVFLIHKKTGLPIGHAVAPAVATQDPSLVSGMLSAIQDFVRDSFHTEHNQGLNRMSVGDLDVWVEIGPYAILAAVIRGVAPHSLHDLMAETLEKIHAEYAAQLQSFDGDTAPFAKVSQQLSRCLESKFKEEQSQTRGYGYALAAGLLLLALLGGWSGWRWWQYQRWNKMVEHLSSQPGLVITGFGHEGGRFVIRGLRDPLAPDPLQFVRDAGLDSAQAEFRWGAYYALDDSLVQKRATAALTPPAGVSLSVTDGVLHLEGQPPAKWLNDVRSRALLIPGIRSLDFGRFTPEQVAFDEAKTKIQGAIVRFPVANASLSAAEMASLRSLMPLLRELLEARAALHENVTIDVIGHSDTTGAEATNQNLSQRRADRVAAQLAQWGIPNASLHTQGVATSQPVRPENSEENRQYNRSATFRILAVPSVQP
ncbi:MAG TPA: OmpA family protein [Candidatus Sulfotelmatobacter sp.]|nr:OmpA family protein [Candidatus Sulfotelmatobacter sp.]